MAAAGSQGETLAAFAKVLGFNAEKAEQLVTNIAQLDRYCKSNPAVELSTAGSVWHQRGLPLGKRWMAVMDNELRAKFGPLDADAMNDFVARETKGKIKDIITAEALVDSVLVLITCLYFKAKWADPFVKSRTSPAPFYTYGGGILTCSMMRRTGYMQYTEDGAFQVCILPYQTEPSSSACPQWKAAIILPKARGLSPMKELISLLAGSDGAVHSLLDSPLGKAYVDLALPRFTLRLTLLLKGPLGSLGLEPAFQPSSDFTPLSDSGPLFISSVSHDLFIEVNETGTEMAAVTVAHFGRSMRPKGIEMRVDRPFLFLIFDDLTKLILGSAVISEVAHER